MQVCGCRLRGGQKSNTETALVAAADLRRPAASIF